MIMVNKDILIKAVVAQWVEFSLAIRESRDQASVRAIVFLLFVMYFIIL
jgi:hypothetical protein